MNIFASIIPNPNAFSMLKSLKKTIILTLISYSFFSCITSGKVNYMQTPGFNIPAYKDSLSFEDYKLRTGDRLYVKVLSSDEKINSLFNGSSNNMQTVLNGSGGMADLYTYLVEQDGVINFPMIGDVYLAGKTLREATSTLEKAMEPLFKYSTVEMHIVNRHFSVIGSGKSVYLTMPQEKINIFKALAMAGDLGIYADRAKVRILRETTSGVQIKVFDVRSADIITSEFFYIEPNDVIYIQDVNEKFFSITNLPNLTSTVLSTISFGVLLNGVYKDLTTSESTQ